MTEKTQEAPTVEAVMALAQEFAQARDDAIHGSERGRLDDLRTSGAELRAAVEVLAKDAARYRWLRHHYTEVRGTSNSGNFDVEARDDAPVGDEDDGVQLDLAIDAAIAQEKP